jgi:pimeloyl-ACP methyl ester carboxylesterase
MSHDNAPARPGRPAPLLAACAAASPVPADFPLRASDQPPFVVSWRLTEARGSVSAEGVLDIDGYVDRLDDATVELVGLDAGGRVVSRAIARLTPRAFAGDRLWPFRLQLTPTGGETRFATRVAEFNWKVEPFVGL